MWHRALQFVSALLKILCWGEGGRGHVVIIALGWYQWVKLGNGGGPG